MAWKIATPVMNSLGTVLLVHTAVCIMDKLVKTGYPNRCVVDKKRRANRSWLEAGSMTHLTCRAARGSPSNPHNLP